MTSAPLLVGWYVVWWLGLAIQGGRGMAGRSTAVDDREFHVVRKGYDRDEVRAYLGEVEVSFHQLERWAEDAKARLRVAEERDRRLYDVDEATVAVFAAKDRVLEGGRLRAERIEAAAREQASLDYEAAAAAVIEEAKEEARRILEETLTSVRAQYESILSEARVDADRTIGEARAEADRIGLEAHAAVADSQDGSGEALVVALSVADDGDQAEIDRERPTHYQRRSARLPRIGDDASDVLRSLESLRNHPD